MHEVGITMIPHLTISEKTQLTENESLTNPDSHVSKDSKQIKNLKEYTETEIGPGASVSRKSFFRSACALRSFSEVYFLFSCAIDHEQCD